MTLLCYFDSIIRALASQKNDQKMKQQSLFVLRLSVLAIATLLWVLCLWAGYVMFHSGIDSRMMGSV